MNRYCERTFEAGSLTREQFIEFLTKDLTAAKMVYDELERTRVRKAWKEAKINAHRQIKEELSKRYKRQTTVEKYLKPKYEAWVEKNQWKHKFFDLNSVRFSIRPWENGGCYYIYIDKTMNDYLGKMWDMHVNNKYLQGCTGWAIVLDKYDHHLQLTLSEELTAEWKADEKRLSDDIFRFYKGTTYWGD